MWISLKPIEHGFNGAALPDFLNILRINGSNSKRETSHFGGVVTVKKIYPMLLSQCKLTGKVFT